MPILNLLPIYCYLNWVRSSHSFKFWAVILCFLSYDIIGPFQISFSTFDFSLQLTSLSSMLSTWIDTDLWQKAIYFHKVKSSDVIIRVEDFNIQIGNDRDQNEKHLRVSQYLNWSNRQWKMFAATTQGQPFIFSKYQL